MILGSNCSIDSNEISSAKAVIINFWFEYLQETIRCIVTTSSVKTICLP